MISLHMAPMVPAHSSIVVEGGCEVQEDKSILPLAMLGHTHSLGTLVQLWWMREGEWELLGKVVGSDPQSFYNLTESRVGQGDWLVGSCEMISDRDTDTHHGLASYQEMCNIYMLYSVEGDQTNLMQGNTYCLIPQQKSWGSF